MKRKKSNILFEEAKDRIPGGVNSPVRACLSVGMNPLFIKNANGCFLYDVDGNKFIDYVCSWGAMILGHCHHSVVSSIEHALNNGISYGAPTECEIELADLIIESVPSVELVRMVNSGTEATMSAIRLSRGYTGRNKIIKFDGCYHGHVDSLLVEAGSGVATLGLPGSLGVPTSVVKDTISLPFNDTNMFVDVMTKYCDEVACVIVEPIAGNMGMIMANIEFLSAIREMTEKFGTVLIFDEVISGFRISLGGAQSYFDIKPDLTCLGKIIGGGLPVGAYGGRLDIMKKVAPIGDVYQAGTLSGNPLAMSAGIATIKELKRDNFYTDLDIKSEKLFNGFKLISNKYNIPLFIDRIGSMIGLSFNKNHVVNYDIAKESNNYFFIEYYKTMLDLGIYIAPSQFETIFVSFAHDDQSIERTISSFEIAMDKLNDL